MIDLVGVVVPAADEQELLGGCLDAITAARRALRRRWPALAVRVVVALDSCTDASAEIVAGYDQTEAVAVDAGRVGAARATGAAHVLRWTALPNRAVWLANTDADSRVRPDWLVGMVELAHAGADVVLGTVLPGPGLPAELERRWRAAHAFGHDHPHVHGANLGIRADAYAALGGWPKLATGEDTVLAGRARAAGHLSVVRTASCPVYTSVRAYGRAPGGFSSYLRGLATGNS
jgi:hypothetical protein